MIHTEDGWLEACQHLSARDPVLGNLIAPDVRLTSRGDPFVTLVRAIVGQQISVKAAEAVWQRLNIQTPACVLGVDPEDLRARGLSRQKAVYMRAIAEAWHRGHVTPHLWPDMSDDDVLKQLVQIKGIGRWTAEMFLIFNLLRPDIFPIDDIGLHKAIRKHYGAELTIKDMLKLGETWAPYRTVATWYLWRDLDPIPVEY